MSKKKQITPDDFGIDGWYVDITTEKNKQASSSHTIRAVFDKHSGIDKFHSEFEFLSSHCPSEEKYFKKTVSDIDLPIKQKGAYYYLTIQDRSNPTNRYTSSTFYIKEAKKKYETDPEFKAWFDYATFISVQERIVNGILKIKVEETVINQIEETIDNYIPEINQIEETVIENIVNTDNQSDYQITTFDHTSDIDNPVINNIPI